MGVSHDIVSQNWAWMVERWVRRSGVKQVFKTMGQESLIVIYQHTSLHIIQIGNLGRVFMQMNHIHCSEIFIER